MSTQKNITSIKLPEGIMFGEFKPHAYYNPGLAQLHIRFEDRSELSSGHALGFDSVFDAHNQKHRIGFNIYCGGYIPHEEEHVESFLRRIGVYDSQIRELLRKEWEKAKDMIIHL